MAWGLGARTVGECAARGAADGCRSIRGRIRADPVHATLAVAATALMFALLPGAIGLASVLHRTRARAAPAAYIKGSRADCVYSANSITVLHSFERMVNRQFNCALVFNDDSPDWASWERPWFLARQDPAHSWGTWATTPGTHRQLIITNNLFPSNVNDSDWLAAGAAGAYDGHARALARNLVAAGLGNSVIRLAHEANNTLYPYSLIDNATGLERWRLFWRRTVLAMRSVPGAHFLFDWCINAHRRPIQLSEWYPGDDVVNIIGIDAYDSGVPAGANRWATIYNQSDGIRDVLAFARAHGKPVSLPEWGLWEPGSTTLGGGDDSSYVNGIASVVRGNPIAYQAYFYNLASQALLQSGSHSLSAYRRHFGGGGDSVGAAVVSPRG